MFLLALLPLWFSSLWRIDKSALPPTLVPPSNSAGCFLKGGKGQNWWRALIVLNRRNVSSQGRKKRSLRNNVVTWWIRYSHPKNLNISNEKSKDKKDLHRKLFVSSVCIEKHFAKPKFKHGEEGKKRKARGESNSDIVAKTLLPTDSWQNLLWSSCRLLWWIPKE